MQFPSGFVHCNKCEFLSSLYHHYFCDKSEVVCEHLPDRRRKDEKVPTEL